MADDDEIVVSLPPEFDIDGDGGTTVVTKTEGEGKVKTPPAEDPIADLKGQFATLQSTHNQTAQRLGETAQRLSQTERELADTKKEVVTSQLDTVTTGLEAAESDAKAAEQAYTVAFEAGDGAAMARAQRSIAKAEARISRLQEAQEDLKDQTTATKTTVREPTQQRTAPADPVERFTAQMAPRAAAWIRAHPDCVTDEQKNKDMLKEHHRALADGLVEGGDEYFSRLDQWVSGGSTKAAQRTEPKTEPQTITRRPSAPVAPAGGSGTGASGGTTVTLTKGEVEAATDGTHVHTYSDPGGKFKKGDVIGVQEFARRKAIMMKQGLYDRTLTT